MSGRATDGFDYIPAGAAYADQLLQAGNWFLRGNGVFGSLAATAVTGRFGFGQALAWDAILQSNGAGLRNVLVLDDATPATEGFIGLGVYIGSNNELPVFVGFYDAVTDAPQVTAAFHPNGVIRAWRGYPSSGDLVATSAAGSYQTNEWFRFEAGARIDDAAGTFEGRVNTEPVFTLVATDTNATGVAGFDSIVVGCLGQNLQGNRFHAMIDDLTVNDAAGALNNTFLGNVRVKTQFTAGAGGFTDFAPTGAATNWQAALNTLLDDTKYNASPDVGDEDRYAVEAILGAQTVHFWQLRAGLRQTDATQRKVKLPYARGGTEVLGPEKALNQTYTFYKHIEELDPTTGLGATGTQLNASEIGLKITA